MAETKTSRPAGRRIKPKPPERASAVMIARKNVADTYPSIARTLTRPEVGAAAAIETWQTDTHDINALADELSAQVAAVNAGDLRRAEAMLISQAQTLNEVFNNLMRRATTQKLLVQWETYMRLGMKAQSQCRSTLEALAEMKHPRSVAFVKQANIAHGHQQVNNGVDNNDVSTPRAAENRAGTGDRRPARTEETDRSQSKLLEHQHGEWMDTGAPSPASAIDSQMAPMGKSDGAENRRG